MADIMLSHAAHYSGGCDSMVEKEDSRIVVLMRVWFRAVEFPSAMN